MKFCKRNEERMTKLMGGAYPEERIKSYLPASPSFQILVRHCNIKLSCDQIKIIVGGVGDGPMPDIPDPPPPPHSIMTPDTHSTGS